MRHHKNFFIEGFALQGDLLFSLAQEKRRQKTALCHAMPAFTLGKSHKPSLRADH